MNRPVLLWLASLILMTSNSILADQHAQSSVVDQGLEVRRVILPASYLLHNDAISPTANRYLKQLARVMQSGRIDVSSVVLIGHSDKRKNLVEMDSRSMQVVQLVKHQLVAGGVPEEQIGILGLGALRPNPRGEDWRVEMDITGYNLPRLSALRSDTIGKFPLKPKQRKAPTPMTTNMARMAKVTAVVAPANTAKAKKAASTTKVSTTKDRTTKDRTIKARTSLQPAPRKSAQGRLRKALLSRKLSSTPPSATSAIVTPVKASNQQVKKPNASASNASPPTQPSAEKVNRANKVAKNDTAAKAKVKNSDKPNLKAKAAVTAQPNVAQARTAQARLTPAKTGNPADPGIKPAYGSVAPKQRYIQFLRDVGSRSLMELSYPKGKLLESPSGSQQASLSDEGQILIARLSKSWLNDPRFRGAMIIGRYQGSNDKMAPPAKLVRAEMIRHGIQPQHLFYMVVPTNAAESIDIAVVRKPLKN